MEIVFYAAAAVAVLATGMVITQRHAVHALLYLIVSLLSVALMFYLLGAAFVAALEVIIYAGAIMVLFVFVIMMLNLGPAAAAQERQWLHPRGWIGPAFLALILVGELLYALAHTGTRPTDAAMIEPQQVSTTLFGPYLLGVELASMLLLAALVGTYHLGQRSERKTEEPHDLDSPGTRLAPGRHPLRVGIDRPVSAP